MQNRIVQIVSVSIHLITEVASVLATDNKKMTSPKKGWPLFSLPLGFGRVHRFWYFYLHLYYTQHVKFNEVSLFKTHLQAFEAI